MDLATISAFIDLYFFKSPTKIGDIHFMAKIPIFSPNLSSILFPIKNEGLITINFLKFSFLNSSSAIPLFFKYKFVFFELAPNEEI